MKKKVSYLKNIFLCAIGTPLLQFLVPISYAAGPAGGGFHGGNPAPPASDKAVAYVVLIINELLDVFLAAGFIFLAYGTVSLVLAMKDENAESKVQATSKVALAIALIGFSTLLTSLAKIVGVTI